MLNLDKKQYSYGHLKLVHSRNSKNTFAPPPLEVKGRFRQVSPEMSCILDQLLIISKISQRGVMYNIITQINGKIFMILLNQRQQRRNSSFSHLMIFMACFL